VAGSSDPTAKQRKLWSNLGWAMPDGSYYIRPLNQGGADDLSNAVRAVGRGENAGDSGAAIRKHIMSRAKDLGLSKDIPDTWNSDGTLKAAAQHFDNVDEFLEHFGVKGMHWGVRKGESSRAPSSEDHTESVGLRKKAKAGGGIHVLSNDELQTVNNRLNLERSYSSLVENKKQSAAGEKFVKSNLGRVKLGLDAVDTGVRVIKTVNEVKKVAKK
jgi:hypothetical protein